MLFYNKIVLSYNQIPINNIQFKGLCNVPFKTAISKIPFKTGETINKKKTRNIIFSLFSMKKFENIKILLKNDNLIIQVKEYPMIKKISVIGNKTLEKKILKKYLKQLNIKNGEHLIDKNINEFKNKIQEIYYDIGKFNSNIKIIKIPLKLNKVNLKIILYEGHSAKIQQINIIGNKKFKLNKLIHQFELNKNFPLINFFINKKYKKEKFIQGLTNIQNFYLENGYIKFNINSAYINLTPDKKNIYLTINIKEGTQYSLKTIKLKINKKKYYKKIAQIINIKSNSIYNNKKIKTIIKQIKNFLQEKGYFYPKIFNQIEINEKEKNVNLNINIKTGNQIYVRKICFQGNKITQDFVLRSLIKQLEGTKINRKFVEISTKKLNKTGFFELVKMNIKPVKNILDQVDIIYHIKERNTGSINLGIGLGTKTGVNFQIALQENNLFGSGKSIKILANKNDFSNYSEISFKNPFFTINNFSLSEQIFYNNFNKKNINLSGYKNKFYGMNNNLTIPINENNKFNLGSSFIKNYLSNIQPQASIWRYLLNTNNNIQFNEKTTLETNDCTINLSWIFDNLNNKLFPTKGQKTLIKSKITIPGSINKYYKIYFHTSQYFPIQHHKDWILFYQGEFGCGNGFHKKELPFHNNFYLGGIENLRGFYSNNIGPKAIYLKQNNQNKIYPKINSPSNDPIGGNMMFFSSLELIFPTPFYNKNYEKFIRTSIFFDAGNVWDSNWKKTPKEWIINMPNYGNPFNIRISTGITFRLISPIGPLIFSYSKPLKFFNNDKIEKFQFNIGKTW